MLVPSLTEIPIDGKAVSAPVEMTIPGAFASVEFLVSKIVALLHMVNNKYR